MSLLGGPERSALAGIAPACLVLLCAAFLLSCSSGRLQVAGHSLLEDGVCQGVLGKARELWAGPTLGVAVDGSRTFFVDGKEGHLHVATGDGAPAVLATGMVAAPERVTWGWLGVDRSYVYWIPGQLSGPRGDERQLVRVPKGGGTVQPGLRPRAPVISVHIDEVGGLLLTEEGLWQLDLRDWGKARLLRGGQFASLTADRARAYLRPVRDAAPMDFVAHMVLDEISCAEPTGTRIVAVDRASGAGSVLFDGADLSLFGPLVQDDTHLYVAAAPTSLLAEPKSCRVRRLLRIAKDTGTFQGRRIPVGIGGDLIQLGAKLYWIDPTSGRIFATPKEGGPITVVAQLPCRPNRLLAAGAGLDVWKADGGPCGLSTVSVTSELATAAANLEAGDALLAVAGGWAYLADADDQLRRVSLARGTSEPIRFSDGTPVTAVQAAVVGESLFFVGPEFLGRWSPAAKEVVRVHEGRARALATDGDDLYVATDDGTIVVLGKSGGASKVILGAGGSVRDLAAFNRAVFWIEGPALSREGARALWTSGPDGLRTQLVSVDGMSQIASDGRAVYYATEGRGRLLPSEKEVSGSIMRYSDGQARQLADRQETVTDLRASPRGVFWRQRHGVRRLDGSGALQALDCTVADQGVGLVEADGAIYWADATARALMMARLPPTR